MQSVSSRIWTRVAVSISYDDNHYTTGTSLSCMSSWTYGLLWVLVILFSCCLSIRLFCYVPFVTIFCSKFFFSLLHLVVGISSYPLLQLAGIFFCFFCFGMSCLVCVVWSWLVFLLIFLLPPVPFELSPRVVLFVFIVRLLFFSFRPNIFSRFSDLNIFACCKFLTSNSSVISRSSFEILFVFFWGKPIL